MNKASGKLESYMKRHKEKSLFLISTGVFPLLETIEEVEEYREKLLEYKSLMGDVDNFQMYEQYVKKQMEKIDRKIIAICKKNSRNALTLLNQNIVVKFFQNILKLIRGTKEKEL